MMDDATRAQVQAANPLSSTWLSANAGSGKTRVLTNRVARLLLRGADPRNILCLTYTKAAASEMQNRLFKTLGDWAMQSDAKLRAALEALGETPPDDLSKARTLFARAIEVPGGLRIQTIHALCSAILRQFPLEGGVSPEFRELDDVARDALIEDVLDSLAMTQPEALTDVSIFYNAESLVGLCRQVSAKADEFVITNANSDVFRYFGISPDLTVQAILDSVFFPGDLRNAVRCRQSAVSKQFFKRSEDGTTLESALPNSPSLSALKQLESIFLTGESANPFTAKVGKVPTKAGQKIPEIAPHLARLDDLMLRIEEARTNRISLEAAAKNAAMHRFANAFLPSYEAAKIERGVLDFDDLIRRTRDMLTGPAIRWVLYRLDGQIDHILVDEAQDTSPAQWQIVSALTDAMADDDSRERTLFVVGDKKQSIYSFQGADAESFDGKAQDFDKQLSGKLQSRELLHSFRSSTAILSLVDTVCDGLDGLGDSVQHHAYFGDKPGRIDLLPLMPPPDDRR